MTGIYDCIVFVKYHSVAIYRLHITLVRLEFIAISSKLLSYNILKDHRFILQTVNHGEHCIDINIGAHTQTIESLLILVKTKYNIKINYLPLLDCHLKEEW